MAWDGNGAPRTISELVVATEEDDIVALGRHNARMIRSRLERDGPVHFNRREFAEMARLFERLTEEEST